MKCKKLFLLAAAMVLLCTILATAANAFEDTFSDISSYDNWNDVRPWAVVDSINGWLVKTTPAGTEDYLSAKELFTYGVFNLAFRTTTVGGTYAYLGWHGMGWTPYNSFADPVAYLRLDTDQLHLTVKNGAFLNTSALPAPIIVTPGVWHNLKMIWEPGSISVSLDGVSGGTFANVNIPSTPLELAMRTYNGKTTGEQVFEVDKVSVTPVPAPGTFIDTFSDTTSYYNWNDLRPWAVIDPINGWLVKTTPAGEEDYLSAKQLFTYGKFNIIFRTTTVIGTYAYLGWHGMGWTPFNNFANPVAYMRLDADQLHLTVVNGSYVNGSALPAPIIVTPGVWHNLEMIWKEGSIAVSLDGVPGGTFTDVNIPSTPLELAMRTYNGKTTGEQVFEVDSVSVIPVPVACTLSGTVNLADFGGDKTAVWGTVEVGANSYPLVLDNDGKFTITDIAEGTYDVRIKASHWLAKITAGVVVAGDTVMDPISLINGDIDDNNEVDFTDINIVRSMYGEIGE